MRFPACHVCPSRRGRFALHPYGLRITHYGSRILAPVTLRGAVAEGACGGESAGSAETGCDGTGGERLLVAAQAEIEVEHPANAGIAAEVLVPALGDMLVG